MVDIKSRKPPRGAAAAAQDTLPDAVAEAFEVPGDPDRRGFSEEELRRSIELMFFAYRDMTKGPDEMLATMGLGRAHHRVIHFIGRNPGVTVAALLTLLRITKLSLARVLRDVRERHLVLQRQGIEDRRQRQLFLTPRGAALEAQLSAVQQENLARAFGGVPAAAIDGWHEVLWSMLDAEDRDRLQHALERRQRHEARNGDEAGTQPQSGRK